MASSSKHQAIAAQLLEMVTERGVGKTICPSEVARSLCPTKWRGQMDDVRKVATELAAAGQIVVTQRGEQVDPFSVRGPIRLGLPTSGSN